METLLIALLVLAAAGYLIYVFYKSTADKPGNGCGGDCSGCGQFEEKYKNLGIKNETHCSQKKGKIDL